MGLQLVYMCVSVSGVRSGEGGGGGGGGGVRVCLSGVKSEGCSVQEFSLERLDVVLYSLTGLTAL